MKLLEALMVATANVAPPPTAAVSGTSEPSVRHLPEQPRLACGSG